MIVLDTDIISILDARAGAAYQSLAERLREPLVDRVAVTIISIEEKKRDFARVPNLRVEDWTSPL